MKEFSLVIHLLSNAGNPNIPPEVFWYPTEAKCQEMRAVWLKHGLARKVECVHWSERVLTIAR